MMNDMLSQEEINALLKGSLEETSSEDTDEVLLNDIEKDAVGEIGNISMGTSATTLFTLLGQKVNITTPTVDIVTLNEMASRYPLPFVAVEVGYKEGLTGSNLLVLKEDDVKVITSLMMGGDGKSNLPEELDEIHLSAISEAMNQMIGSSATALSDMISKKIDINPPKVYKVNLSNKDYDFKFMKNDEKIARISFKMTIGDLVDSNIMQLLPIDFAKSLVDNMLYGDSGNVSLNQTNSNNSNSEPAPVSNKHVQEVSNMAQQSTYNQNTQPIESQVNAQPVNVQPVNVQPVKFESFESQNVNSNNMPENIDIIKDVLLNVTVELGRTKKSIDDILEFSPGTIIELDRLVGEPLDILVNSKKVAKGEVVVIDENYGIRITDIIKPEKRLRSI
ncbi:MAG: flagellar motor switch phosphatase FliY [Tepidibacter sp.]|jgi:flagellar motor switch protein FliN/FliY|uniref:flagellar motor switch phosphatase FliY n=1 Tax=Tepidibacter sp. TaxID=2529387 RepID=UPI0025CBA9FB|nr:flagellar motor switch phosphatase FliY [Tepidibacter sp.]MCT4507989.1 flagellar motor switch phosphatase FliY [Tepidibacter sp.]